MDEVDEDGGKLKGELEKKLKVEKEEEGRVKVPMERIPHSLSEQGLLGDQDLPVFQETTHPGGSRS